MPRGPNVLAVPPKPRQGERIHIIAVIGQEDAEQAVARVKAWSPWVAPRIIGKPVRVGQRWHFVVRVP